MEGKRMPVVSKLIGGLKARIDALIPDVSGEQAHHAHILVVTGTIFMTLGIVILVLELVLPILSEAPPAPWTDLILDSFGTLFGYAVIRLVHSGRIRNAGWVVLSCLLAVVAAQIYFGGNPISNVAGALALLTYVSMAMILLGPWERRLAFLLATLTFVGMRLLWAAGYLPPLFTRDPDSIEVFSIIVWFAASGVIAILINTTMALLRNQTIELQDHISDLDKMGLELRESEERYRALIENLGEGIGFVDLEERFTYANPAAQEIFGVSREDLVGSDLMRFLDAENQLIVRGQTAQSQAGQSNDYELDIVRPDGERRNLLVTTTPRFDPKGQFTGAFGVFRDITARQRAEEAQRQAEDELRENERLLRTIAENYPHSYISIIERDLTVGFTSGQEFHKQNLDPEQFVGLSLEQVFGDQIPVMREHYLKTFAGQEQTFELFVNNQHQLYRTVPLYAEDGTIPRILSVAENITERKQAEEKIASLAKFPDENPNPVLRVAQDGTILYANTASKSLLAFWSVQVNGQMPVEWRQPVSDALAQNETRTAQMAYNGRIFAFTLTPVAGAGYVNLYGLDITERKRTEEALRESEEKYRMLAEAAHDMIILVDHKARIQYTNKFAAELFGKASHNLIGKNIAEVFPPKVAARQLASIQETFRTGEAIYRETPTVFPGGTVWLGTWLSPAKDANGETTSVLVVSRDITERKRAEEHLKQIEWLLTRKIDPRSDDSLLPFYGDLTTLNMSRVILDSIGPDMLSKVAGDYLSLLQTSSAIYEANGDYALGIFSSGWCKLLDSASYKLCGTDDNRIALSSGKWLCHESCWNEASKASIEKGEPVDIECNGGIHLYAIPIRAGSRTVGSMNFGYGTPPQDPEKLREIADKYRINIDQLREHADAYETRPPFLIEVAKERLQTSALLIGEIIERKQAEESLEERSAFQSTLLETVPIPVFYKDSDGRYLGCNKAFETFFGKKAERLVGKSVFDINPPELAEVYHAKDRELFETGGKQQYESQVKNSDGALRQVIFYKSAFVDNQGGAGGLIGAVLDITERVRAEEAIQEYSKRLEEMVTERTRALVEAREQLLRQERLTC
jgi:PAS domain S-box-containing protein